MLGVRPEAGWDGRPTAQATRRTVYPLLLFEDGCFGCWRLGRNGWFGSCHAAQSGIQANLHRVVYDGQRWAAVGTSVNSLHA